MATDLVATISRFITPDTIAKIASGLGINRQAVEQAVAAGIPTILSGLVGLTARPEGAQRLASVLLQQPPGMLDEVKHALGGAEQAAMADHGSSILSALLGGGTMKSVAAAITDYAGIKEGAGKAILGLLGPMVLGALGQQQRVSGLDAGGIANLLASQKDSIAKALPRGFAEQLSGTRILDSIGETWTGDTAAAARAAARPRVPVDNRVSPVQAADTSAGPAPWALAALAIAAVAGLFWLLSGPESEQQVADQTAGRPAVEGRAVAVPSVSVVEVTRLASTSVDGIRTTLASITDASSASDAMPKLRSMAADLDKLRDLAAKLPAESKQQVAAVIQKALPTINELCDKVLADPAAANVARPVVESVRAKLNSITSA
jgi:Bacterial protein of unknown function (DUF937)